MSRDIINESLYSSINLLQYIIKVAFVISDYVLRAVSYFKNTFKTEGTQGMIFLDVFVLGYVLNDLAKYCMLI